MAQKVEIKLLDDIDGGEAHETVTFGLNGRDFEIDLNDTNANKLRELLDPYVKHGRRIKTTGAPGRTKATASEDKEDLAKVRAWAAENGFDVKPRGRIPREVVEAYKAGTPADTSHGEATNRVTRQGDPEPETQDEDEAYMNATKEQIITWGTENRLALKTAGSWAPKEPVKYSPNLLKEFRTYKGQKVT